MISVIIPVLNEAARIGGVLAALALEKTPHEIIVVDGGSEDGTVDEARKDNCQVLTASGGRGAQLAAGAAAAHGDILLFLHADSVFPDGGLTAIEDALARDAALVGGNFSLRFDGGDKFSRWLDGFYAWIRSHGFYYGDSGIFVRRAIYERLGGIRPIALMEDYEFVRRLEVAGPTCCIDTPPLFSSSRRFVGRHPVAIVCGWFVIHGLFHLGVSPQRLARLYDSTRQRSAIKSVPLRPQS